MFAFVRDRRPMLSFLADYLLDPHWCHSTDVVPMLALTPPEGWPLWSPPAVRDHRVHHHLVRSLQHWSAFRSSVSTPLADAVAALRRHLPDFIADIQAIPEARLFLSDVPESEIRPLARALACRFRRFAQAVKGVDSAVLPSKVAHFLLLGLVPAYDQQVICNQTLRRLLRGASNVENYILMCWWVLQELHYEDALDDARGLVAEYMIEQPMEWTRNLPRPDADHSLLNAMDSVVAEYILIQMAREAEGQYVLRRTWPALV